MLPQNLIFLKEIKKDLNRRSFLLFQDFLNSPAFLQVVRRSRLFVMLFMVCAIVRVICGFGAKRRAECLTFCARLAHSGRFSIFALLPRTASALCVLTSCRFVARCAAFYIICGGCLWCLYPVFLPPRRKLFR